MQYRKYTDRLSYRYRYRFFALPIYTDAALRLRPCTHWPSALPPTSRCGYRNMRSVSAVPNLSAAALLSRKSAAEPPGLSGCVSRALFRKACRTALLLSVGCKESLAKSAAWFLSVCSALRAASGHALAVFCLGLG